jgi:mono/diheme cytochrome c family protein
MKYSMPALLLVLSAAATPVAHGQQSGDALNPTQLEGRQLLAQSCGVCHLQPTLGSKTYGPLLNRTTAAGNDEAMRVIIANGSERMPGFRYYLKPAEVDAIIAYVRTVPAPAVAAAAESKGATQ